MEKTSKHDPVLLDEAMAHLGVRSGESYLDCTFGGGGHSRKILELSRPRGRVVALDRDEMVSPFVEDLRRKYPKRFVFHHLSYDRLKELEQTFDGILFDLGLSSDQLENSGRGFSFAGSEPLDMRFDPRKGQTAAQFLMQAPVTRLERVFKEYGEDRYARALAQKIVEARRREPIRATTDFIRLVGTKQPEVLAPLFQAMRIEVNDELQTLKRGLQQAYTALNTEGRLVIISFHSLEDRIVKEFMRSSGMRLVTKKPIMAGEAEIATNRRSRSAKMRSAIKN